jgi:uncharacterized protein with HEPN domain
MSKRSNSILIEDIIESCNKIFKYTEGFSYENFVSDSKTFDAVIRNFEIIGEAANRLGEDFKDNYTEIDWHKIRGFRNRIVHDYAGVDLAIVWTIIKDYLPNMCEAITKIKL